jgi:CheY-like chemotaxis protein
MTHRRSTSPSRLRQLVIVADADQVFLATTAQVLRDAGYLVITAANRSAARAALQLANAALLLLGPAGLGSGRGRSGSGRSGGRRTGAMDVGLPCAPSLPTVQVAPDARQDYAAGAVAGLSTPMDPTALRETVARVLAGRVAA